MKTNNFFKFMPIAALLLLYSCGDEKNKQTEEEKVTPKVRIEEVKLVLWSNFPLLPQAFRLTR